MTLTLPMIVVLRVVARHTRPPRRGWCWASEHIETFRALARHGLIRTRYRKCAGRRGRTVTQQVGGRITPAGLAALLRLDAAGSRW